MLVADKFSPTKPLILGGTVPYIYIYTYIYTYIYIYTHHISSYIMVSDIISRFCERLQNLPSPWRRRRHRDPPGCGESSAERFHEILLAENFDQSRPEILQDLMVKKWILDVSESFGQLNTQWKTSACRMDLVHRSRIIQLGDAVWIRVCPKIVVCLHPSGSFYMEFTRLKITYENIYIY